MYEDNNEHQQEARYNYAEECCDAGELVGGIVMRGGGGGGGGCCDAGE